MWPREALHLLQPGFLICKTKKTEARRLSEGEANTSGPAQGLAQVGALPPHTATPVWAAAKLPTALGARDPASLPFLSGWSKPGPQTTVEICTRHQDRSLAKKRLSSLASESGDRGRNC